MLQKIAFAGFGIILLASPLLASADTASDLQAKIDAILGQVRELQAQYEALVKQPPTTSVPPMASIDLSGITCPRLGRALAFGARGDDVAGLQKVLIAAGALADGSVTGFFGPLTPAAVQRLQAANGIVSRGSPATTGWGAVGPMTRAWIARWCGNRSFSASPTSGQVPLAVTFRIETTAGDSDTLTVNFGDGATGTTHPTGLGCSTSYCPYYGGAEHTYTSDGTYEAKLIRQAHDGCVGMVCTAYAETVIGSVVIKIGTQTTNPPPVACTTQYLACPAGKHHVDGPGSCQQRCEDDAVAGAPSVTGIDGPAAIGTGQTGLWTVHASVPSNADTSLRYSVIWGDEGVFDQIKAFGNAAAGVLQASGTFTHAYASSGTFRPTFTVTNDAGSAQTSISVVVGKDTTQLNCPQYMAPLCSASETLVAGGYGADGCQLSPRCVSNTTASSGSFSASPASGDAPLMVTFTGVGNSISFGDDSPTFLAVGNGNLGTMTHVYSNYGTYTAKSNTASVNITVDANKRNVPMAHAFWGVPPACVYANRTHNPGTSVNVPVWSCGIKGVFGQNCRIGSVPQATGGGTITTQRYTCQNGQWIDSNGAAVEGQLVDATSCLASDGVTPVGNGQIIVQGNYQTPTLDQLNAYGKRIPTMKCSNGNWLDCDANGNNCTQASADTNTNLANALKAVESALKAIMALLGR